MPNQPVLAVATYSALLLASIRAFGAESGNAYADLPALRFSHNSFLIRDSEDTVGR